MHEKVFVLPIFFSFEGSRYVCAWVLLFLVHPLCMSLVVIYVGNIIFNSKTELLRFNLVNNGLSSSKFCSKNN